MCKLHVHYSEETYFYLNNLNYILFKSLKKYEKINWNNILHMVFSRFLAAKENNQVLGFLKRIVIFKKKFFY